MHIVNTAERAEGWRDLTSEVRQVRDLGSKVDLEKGPGQSVRTLEGHTAQVAGAPMGAGLSHLVLGVGPSQQLPARPLGSCGGECEPSCPLKKGRGRSEPPRGPAGL